MNELIKTIRNNLQLTQKQFSHYSGIPINTIRNWEQSIRKPSEWVLDLIIDRLLRESNESNQFIDETHGILSYLTIKNLVSNVAKNYNVEQIYLFGSYASGKANPMSDIDLFMISDLYELEYFEFVEEIRSILRKKVQLLSNRTIEANSRIDEEIKRTGLLVYER